MPPQGRFNAGEKMYGLITIVAWFVFGLTGVPMWFGKGVIPPELFRWLVVFHDLAMIVSVCMFLVHLYLAVAHPLMWGALVSMRFGVTSAEYAMEHYAKWYYGPRRAMEIWERRNGKPPEGWPLAGERREKWRRYWWWMTTSTLST
jgi:Cytochrome b subunit of formate dehydrogenase